MLIDYRIRQREYLLAISRALTAELDLADVLRIIVQASVEFISGRAGIIALADPDDSSFKIVAVYGIPTRLLEHFGPLLEAVPADLDVVQELTRRMQQIAQTAELGLSQVLRLPMMSGDDLIGMIFVFQAGAYRFTSDAGGLLQSFADQAAIAVKNARLYQQVIAEKQRLDAILEQSADGVMILDQRLTITVFNTAFSHIAGWPAARAIGRPHDEVITWHSLKSPVELNEAMANGWPLPGAAPLRVEGELQRPDSQRISLGITYAPVLDGNGRLTNLIANATDLTRFRQEEELQKTFISIISHELKTPVSIIKGYAGTLRRQDANWSKEVQDEYLTVIDEEADKLNELIDNLLEASRLQSGTFRLDLSGEVSLVDLASETAARLGRQTSRHTFQFDFPPDFPLARGDERRLTQVFSNLISNAIKYSPQGGAIQISGRVYPDYVTVSVRDEGIGIPGHQAHRIFEKFARLDNALSRKTEGTGLGLYLTRAIVEAHGGHVWFSNNDEDNPGQPGTTFTFSLPRE
ncbi:MAG: ATP-binding protein [Chloroflexota bacterium]